MKKFVGFGILGVLVLGMMLGFCAYAECSVPHLINYQGRLTNASGVVVSDGNYSLTMSIYDSATSESPVWRESQSVFIKNGIFSLIMGSSTPINLPFDKDYWLGITVGDDSEMTPRQQIVSVGYSFRTEYAGTATYANQAEFVGTASKALDSDKLTGKLPAQLEVGTATNADNLNSKDSSYFLDTSNSYQTKAGSLSVTGEINTGQYYKIGGNKVLSTPSSNIFVGLYAGQSNTTGSANTFLGMNAGVKNTTGVNNTFLGNYAGYYNTEGYNNTFLGWSAGPANTIGNDNTFLGNYAGLSNTTGSSNTFLGNYAGQANTTGIGNLFLGYSAGYNETGSNKLYIDNSSTNSPLIWGDFNTDEVKINGNFSVTGSKNFEIDHPTKPGYKLIHSCLEGPEVAVFYRGEAKLENGSATIKLPDYFEALTRKEGRTIQLTAKGTTPYSLSYTDIESGEFIVYGTKADGEFSWRVEATRADVSPLQVEVEKAK